MLFLRIYCLFLLLVPFQEKAHANTQIIELLAGLSKPPFVIKQEGKGMQLDIVKAIMAKNNYQVQFVFMPRGRHITAIQELNVDGVITWLKAESNLFLSKPYINYQNVVVTLAEKEIVLSDFKDLSSLNIASFQNAEKFLSKDYQNGVKTAKKYIELANQKLQLTLLFSRKVDAIVLDVNIFKYLLLEAKQDKNKAAMYQKPFNIHLLFPETNYVAGFKNEQVRDLFNQGLKSLKNSGEYQQIIDSYLN